MRKVLFVGLISVFAVMLFTGCDNACLAFFKAYTEQNRINIPEEMTGTFKLPIPEERASEDDFFVTITLSPDENGNGLLEYTQKITKDGKEKKMSSTHEVVFFKINDRLFADMTLIDIKSVSFEGGEFPWLAVVQFTPVHTIVMIVPTEDGFEVYNPGMSDVADLAKKNSADLPYVKEDNYICIASGEQWHAFLEKYADELFESRGRGWDVSFQRVQDAE